MATKVPPDVFAPPPGNPRFPAVDGLRAVAALLVVMFHADLLAGASRTFLGRLLIHCDVGVAVFFAISGFLLYRPFVASAVGDAPRTPTRVFYWRRVLRIVPAYWVALIALAPILLFAHPIGLANVAFVQIYRPAWARTGIPPGWSVCVEVSFYLLLPVFAGVLQHAWSHLERDDRRRRELLLLGGLAIGSTVLRAIVHRLVHNRYAVDPLPATLAWFCGGMALAVVSVIPTRTTRFVRDYPLCPWAAAVVIYAAMLSTSQGPETTAFIPFVAYGAMALLILAPLVLSDPQRFVGGRLALTRPVAGLGLVSYGIYLYHYPLMTQFHPGGSAAGKLLLFAVFGVGVAVACGTISYYLVERPALRLKRIRDYPRL